MAIWALAMFFTSIFALIISSFGIYAVWKTLQFTAETNKLVADQFAADNPPCFEIKQIDIDLPRWVALEPNDRKGELWIFNSGPTPAKIHLSSLAFHAGTTPPASKPFDENKAHNFLEKGQCFVGGEGCWVGFTATDLKASKAQIEASVDPRSKTNFYIIGRIHYRNANDQEVDWDRHTVFCRVYNPTTKRFDQTHDPDYEHQT